MFGTRLDTEMFQFEAQAHLFAPVPSQNLVELSLEMHKLHFYDKAWPYYSLVKKNHTFCPIVSEI